MSMSKARQAELRVICAGKYAANERQRWDVLWEHPSATQFMSNCYADGLQDNHIATGLRVALKPHGSCT